MHGIRVRDLALVVGGLLAVALLLGVPFARIFPVLVVGGCVLMHVLMMGHMARGRGRGHCADADAASAAEQPGATLS